MAKVQTAVRLDQELLDVLDELAKLQGCTRTDVIAGILERGIADEQKFMDVAKIPGLQTLVDGLVNSGLAGVVGKLVGREVDERRVRIGKELRDKRRGVRSSGKVKGAES
jgi:hypothetical protein